MKVILSYLLLLLFLWSPAQKPQPPAVSVQPTASGYRFIQQKTGLPVNRSVWDEVDPFVNGFARVSSNNLFTFVNRSGNPVGAAEFDDARNFSHHLAAVKKGTKWGFINESGKTVIPYRYDIVYDFKDALTGVMAGPKWYLINVQGVVVKTLDITAFYGFKNGVARITKNGHIGTLNTTGQISVSSVVASTTIRSAKTNTLSVNAASDSASICPANIDFEFGNFFNWNCFLGQVDSIGNTNVITVNPSPPTRNRHVIITRSIPAAIDPYGLFSLNPPDGSNFAVKLGNTKVGAQAERISYVLHVPVNDSNFSITYDYAVVLQNPGHTPWTQPRFQAKVFDSAANAYIDCASFEYVSTAGIPGFAVSPVDSSVIYKPWSPVFLSLRGYAGKTLYLEFTTADCVRRAHWGYAYVDVESSCGEPIQQEYDCSFPNITTLTGPPGFQTYKWWTQAFDSLYGTGQQIVLNPGPTINTVIYCEMIPYQDFGCRDTLRVSITGKFNGKFDLSDTTGICAPHTFTFYNRNLPSQSAIWNFGDGTTATGDTVTHTYLKPGTYNTSLNVTLSGGCSGIGKRKVIVLQPSGSFDYTGGDYCAGQQVQFDAKVYYADSLFWDFGDGTILKTKQTSVTHTYLIPGDYVPNLSIKTDSGGCVNLIPGDDTIHVEKLIAGFSWSRQNLCNSTTVSFTDTTHSLQGISARDWDFGDGTTGSGQSVSHSYTVAGTYTIKLVVTGAGGCIDSLSKPVQVTVNQNPSAKITGDSSQCSPAAITFVSQVQSSDAINSFAWSASNGQSGSSANFVDSFTNYGSYTIRLIAGTVNGCSDTAYYPVVIHPSPVLTAQTDVTLCLGSSVTLTVGGASTYAWTPSTNLSCNDCAAPVASPTDSIAYVVTGTNSFGCVTIDTIRVRVIKPFPMQVSPNDSLCVGQTRQISAAGANSYQWSPAAGLSSTTISNPVASPTADTRYRVIGYDAWQCFTDTGYVNIRAFPTPTVDAGPDIRTSTGNIVPIKPVTTNGPIIDWTWTPTTWLDCAHCDQPNATIKSNITYQVSVKNIYGCTATDSINVSVFCESAQVFIPNAFTPDGDGLNDILMVRGKGISVKMFRIFTRWGELVFERTNFAPNDPQFGWDGKIRGIPATPDVYVYTAEVVCDNGVVFTYKGNTTILK